MNTSIARNEMTSPVRIGIAFLLAIVVGATLASAAEPGEAAMADTNLQVIVEASPGAVSDATASVMRMGGEVLQELSIIDGVVARIPVRALAGLSNDPAVTRITPDGRVTLDTEDDGWENAAAIANTYDPKDYAGSMYQVVKQTHANELWSRGHTGDGVGVAVIDSGAVPVDGLTFAGQVINGPDLSLESQAAHLHYLDTNGHGTHLAGIIAGRDDDADDDIEGPSTEHFLGMAPDAHLVSVKVADYGGATDVSQVIAAVDWVVEHRNDPGLNIRVLNLAFGTDGVQPYQLDPLAFAVERAWTSGIVVVVSAGNDGTGAPLRNPATDPFVITVGASDANDTRPTTDDFVASFSSCGTPGRHVDVVAPGRSIVSLRNPGSNADVNHPEARIGQRFFLGSGTSQAAAVVSGAAALIIGQRPAITPNQVKQLLMDTAQPIATSSPECMGAGLIDLEAARTTTTPYAWSAVQQHGWSSGSGLLELARGTHHIAEWVPADPAGGNGAGSASDPATSSDDAVGTWVPLVGELDIFGMPFQSQVHAVLSLAGMAWVDGTWNGSVWTGSSWSGSSWSGSSWSGSSWSGSSWSGSSWSGSSWSSNSWNGSSWSGSSWSGSSWSGSSWSGSSWSGNEWSKSPFRFRIHLLTQRIR